MSKTSFFTLARPQSHFEGNFLQIIMNFDTAVQQILIYRRPYSGQMTLNRAKIMKHHGNIATG